MIHIIIGTKAQLIKMAPVMATLAEKGIQYNFIYTGQHRSTIEEMLSDFGIKKPDITLYDGKDITSIFAMIVWSLRLLVVSFFQKIDADKIETAITSKTKALVIQHTFGAAADVEKIMTIARKHNLLVVEDCAHSLGESLNGILLGNFGDLAIFSFGSDNFLSDWFNRFLLNFLITFPQAVFYVSILKYFDNRKKS